MRPFILAILLLLAVSESAFGQGVDVQIDTVPVDVLRLSDFDPLNPSATSVFFVVTVTNDDSPRDLAIRVDVRAVRAGYLGSAYLELGQVPPNGIIVRTNQEFEAYDVGDAAEDLVDFALERGVLPPDEYVFKVVVIDQTGGGEVIVGEEDDSIITTNPTTNLDLVGPGTEFWSEPEELSTPQPLFQWLSNATDFELTVFEVRPGQISPEDVATNLPVYTARDLSVETFAYPSFAEQLKHGVTYAWQVNALVGTASGTARYPSQMYWFTFNSPTEDDFEADNVFVNSLRVDPQESAIKPGESVRFTYEVFDADGALVLNAVPSWRIVPDRLGEISEDGVFTAGDESGAVAVVASFGDVEDYATVVVETVEEVNSRRDSIFVEVLSPVDGQEFLEPSPDFLWQASTSDSTFRNAYLLTVRGPIEFGAAEQAPVFWQHNVTGASSTSYPGSVPGLQPGNTYAMTVSALDERNNILSTSEGVTFSLATDPKISWEVLNAWDVARRQQTDSLMLPLVLTLASPPLQQTVRDELVGIGAVIEIEADPWVQLSLPFYQIDALAAIDGISLVSLPSPHILFSDTTQSIDPADVETFKPLPGRVPIKVAVFEFGFDQNAITSLVGGRVTYHSFRADGAVGGSNTVDALHGLASVQALFEYLPRTAEVHLINFNTEPEFKAALTYAIDDLGVDLISCSVSWANAYDHYDGTSFFTRSVVDILDDDATMIVAAGNFAQSHWEGSYEDNNLNGAHDFTPGNDFLEVQLDNTKRYTLLLSWDEWGAPTRNLDVEILNDRGERLSDAFGRPYASRNVQSADGYIEPMERIRNFQPLYPGVRTYRIRLTSPNRPSPSDLAPNFELYIYPPPEGSVPEPDAASSLASGLATARSNSIIPVGASSFEHSSQGPTNDGRVRPDFSTSGVIRLNQATFEGTSFSTPRVTAVIASVISMHPEWTRQEISNFLQNATYGGNPAEKSNQLGWGSLDIEAIISALGTE
ncbi:MAG: S8 family serine peptidase [Rhodothermales bacterium]|nr:S8 family serine peptidase [Rhodothermales bacterium]